MTLEYGLLLGIIGTTLTVIGFFIALSVGARIIEKEKRQKELEEKEKENPVYGLFK